MPYIPQEKRERLDWIAKNLAAELSDKDITGKLNYFIFKVIIELRKHKQCHSYKEISRYLAELHECEEEIRRRILVKHENKVIKINGDVL